MHATRSSTMTVRASTPVSSIDGRQANLFNRQLYLHCALEQTMTAAQTPCCMPLPLLQESPASRAEMAHSDHCSAPTSQYGTDMRAVCTATSLAVETAAAPSMQSWHHNAYALHHSARRRVEPTRARRPSTTAKATRLPRVNGIGTGGHYLYLLTDCH